MNLDEKTVEELLAINERVNDEIRKRKRQDRQNRQPVSSPREQKVFEEYDRRIKAEEQLAPLVAKVDLETLVGHDIYEQILEIDEGHAIVGSSVRGVDLKFFTPNLRALWQSVGQEHIEPDLLNFIDGCGDHSVYFDVGASTGVFSIYAAAKGIKTYCFEPEASNFNILNFNALLNFANIKPDNINCFNLAVSDTEKTESIYIKKFEAAAHEKILGTPKARDSETSFEYEYKQRAYCVSLDDFCRREQVYPTDIKIDVDGVELDVVRGMRGILKEGHIQRIFIEISENDPRSSQTLEMLLDAGYKIHSKTRVQNYFDENNYVLHKLS